MTVLFKRLTVFRFLTVPPLAVHGLPKYVQHGKITSGIFPRTTLKNTPSLFPSTKLVDDTVGAVQF